MTDSKDDEYDWGTAKLTFGPRGLQSFTSLAHDGSHAAEFARSPDGQESWVSRSNEQIRTKHSPEFLSNDDQELNAGRLLQRFLNDKCRAEVWDELTKQDERIDPATDLLIGSSALGRCVMVQVVRADIDTERWQLGVSARDSLSFIGETDLTVPEATDRLLGAVNKKMQLYTPSVRNERVLLLDASCVPEANDAVVRERVSAAMPETGFRAVYVAGFSHNQVAHLAGEQL